jgi:hypothetical protein
MESELMATDKVIAADQAVAFSQSHQCAPKAAGGRRRDKAVTRILGWTLSAVIMVMFFLILIFSLGRIQ